MALRRNGRARALAPDVFSECVAGIAAVSHHPARRLCQATEQGTRHLQFVRLARRLAERNGTAAAVQRSRRLWCHSRHAIGQAPHAYRVGLQIPLLAAPAAF
jgi:hypothetical protein